MGNNTILYYRNSLAPLFSSNLYDKTRKYTDQKTKRQRQPLKSHKPYYCCCKSLQTLIWLFLGKQCFFKLFNYLVCTMYVVMLGMQNYCCCCRQKPGTRWCQHLQYTSQLAGTKIEHPK